MGAAIVSGLVSGTLVLLGVVAAERLRRAGEQRQRIERSCTRVPLLVSIITETAARGAQQAAWAEMKELLTAATEIEALTRQRRKHRRTNELTVDLLARLAAASTTRTLSFLQEDQAWEVVTQLLDEVFGPPGALALRERLDHYLQHGAGAPVPSPRT